jgi:tetratricopeptide (TPR) repeat protein
MKKDARGIPLTGASDDALTHYETAIDQFQSYVGDPVATLDEAIAQTPAFVAGHLMKALVLYTLAERRFAAMSKEALDAARTHLPSANARERGLAHAAEALVDGRWDDACAALDRVLANEPRDALALQVAHLMDFYRGDALNLRNRVTRVMPHWDASTPGYSYVVGMHAFGLEEMNQYPEAEAAALRALSLQRKDGWAVHAAVHVMEMQGRIDEGIAFLREREADWAPDNAFAFHNFWHLALFYMDGARHADALALFDRHVHPEPAAYLLSLVDATALLWRLQLEGADVGDRHGRVADEWESRMHDEGGFYAFNDVHAAMAYAMAGRDGAMTALVAKMQEAARAAGPRASVMAEVGIPLAHGLASFGRGAYAEAIRRIEPVRDVAQRFGGSHAQRDLLTLTLIEAAIRAGDRVRARHYAAERTVHKPASAWGRRLWSRAGTGEPDWRGNMPA